MRITAIKQQVKNPERVSIFIEGKYSFSLTLDQLLEQKLKKDFELDEARIKNLKKLSDEGKLKARALEWLMGRPHSVREFRDYLYKKKTEPELITALIEEFQGKNYLNDELFARWFAENRLAKRKSQRAIIAELRTKGVSPVTIQNIVNELQIDSAEIESLRALVNKLRKRSRYQEPLKLKQYLASKGFNYDLIKQVTEE